MNVSSEQWATWESILNSGNTVNVVNTMVDIGREIRKREMLYTKDLPLSEIPDSAEDCTDARKILASAGEHLVLAGRFMTLPSGTKLTFQEFRQKTLEWLDDGPIPYSF